MYHALLTNRYLRTRVIPLIAVAAVGLCVALVIIVVSVMTGFLGMVKDAGRTLMGDAVVSYPVRGLPNYDDLIARIDALPQAAAAVPVVDGFGLLRMPYPDGPRKETETIQFWAVDPIRFAAVTEYGETLYWKPPTEAELAALGEDDFRRTLMEARDAGAERLEQAYEAGRTLVPQREDEVDRPGIVMGIHVSRANERQKDGTYRPIRGPLGYWWMPRFEVVLTTLPVDTAVVSPQPESVALQVVNEFTSGVFLIDDTRVIIPLEVGQRLMHLDEAAIVDEEGEETGLVDPARATMVLIRAADGVTPDQLVPLIRQAYMDYRQALMRDETIPFDAVPPPEGFGVMIQTWLEQQEAFIAPIEKERELMRVLFSIIYLVCAGLVLAIFWAIVYEKTRDIGILRSVGASRLGITFIFLRYGAVIGVAGSILGLGLAWLVVHNINVIHNAMGEQAPPWLWISLYVLAGLALAAAGWTARRGKILPVSLWLLLCIVLLGAGVGLMFHKGTLIWDPSVYYFSEIPNDVDMQTAAITMIGAVIFSVLGAFFPAAKAADIDPVRALRYE